MATSSPYTLDLLVLQPTPFCNINCDYCYLPNRLSKRILSHELIDHIFREIFNSEIVGSQLTVVWHAGEPLVLPASYYRKAFQNIAELNTLGCRINHSIQTNGMLVNQEWCDLIKEYSVRVGLSIDGPAFIHDKHRKTRAGQGTHAQTMKGAMLLKKNNIDFHAISVLTQYSLKFPDEIFWFFLDKDIRHVCFNIEEIEGIHITSSLKKGITDKEYYQFMCRIYELSKNTKDHLKIREFDSIDGFIRSRAKTRKSQQVTPFSIISIDCDGNFTTYSPELLGMKSPEYGDFFLGNIWNDTFTSVIESEKFQAIHRDIQKGVTLCKATCKYFDVCGGGAASNKYHENGTFCSTETMYCKYAIQIPVEIVLGAFERDLIPVESSP